MSAKSTKLSIAGLLAAKFQDNPITGLIALVALLLGAFAIMVTPREEEPQIDVTFANVYVGLPGASAKEVENLISFPAEQVIDSIDGIKHVYSMSRPGMAVITAEFEVGIPRETAIVRLYNEIHSNADWLPPSLGATPPLVRPMGIDDVPIVTVTFWTDNPDKGQFELEQVSHALEAEIKRIPNTRIVETIGGPDHVVHVLLEPEKMAAYNIDFDTVEKALQITNVVTHSGDRIDNNRNIPVQTGLLLASAKDVRNLVISTHNGHAVYLQDIATVVDDADTPQSYVWFTGGPAWQGKAKPDYAPAVTLAIGKKPGSNAVEIANQVIAVGQKLKNTYIPDDIHFEITRNYGKTANDKAEKLIHKLIFATLSVVFLILITLGWREAIVVGLAVTITLALTLFASWAYGFTLNRVSLFALIFSIGILVDDAVVIVENIHRHMMLEKGKKLFEIIPHAVDEVGGPTILATFTVIAALMPMAFVSGLMGPYMSPIPINASMGMLISLLVALMVTPWLFRKVIGDDCHHDVTTTGGTPTTAKESRFIQFFHHFMQRFLGGRAGRKARYTLILGIVGLLFASFMLIPTKRVILKMLPFDNKSEFQVVVDLPEGATVEQTSALLEEITAYLKTVPEIKHVAGYAGTASPINFNGLVRQYFLRQQPHMGDVQVTLKDKHERKRQSHEIALEVRPHVYEIGKKYNASVKVVEVPPGPPVLSPILAEIYGPDDETLWHYAKAVENIFASTDGIVDIDSSVEADSPRDVLVVDRPKAAELGVPQATVAKAMLTALSGYDATYLHDPNNKYAVPIRLELPAHRQGDLQTLLNLPVKSMGGSLIRLDEISNIKQDIWEKTRYHKDLMPVAYVAGDMAGKEDSPLYGMFELVEIIKKKLPELEQYFIHPPLMAFKPALKWDGEWQITYETFRDMGLAYAVGLILIYLLIVAQFQSYFVPLIIMAPIPLTLAGVLPGHWLAHKPFTATSMIGIIALAGIIVRNSILLVDFIRMEVLKGQDLEQAVIQSAIVRAKPIILTGVAAMMGAFFILDDPIFSGLAISLISGILVSTILTLVVIPVLYYWYVSRQLNKGCTI